MLQNLIDFGCRLLQHKFLHDRAQLATGIFLQGLRQRSEFTRVTCLGMLLYALHFQAVGHETGCNRSASQMEGFHHGDQFDGEAIAWIHPGRDCRGCCAQQIPIQPRIVDFTCDRHTWWRREIEPHGFQVDHTRRGASIVVCDDSYFVLIACARGGSRWPGIRLSTGRCWWWHFVGDGFIWNGHMH